MTNHPSERRRAPRVAADFTIQLQGASGATREGQVKDLSEIGLCCTFPESIDEMTAVKIGLQLPGDDRLLEVQGAVVRCDEVASAEASHEIAVYFTDTPEPSREALRAFVTQAAAG